MAISKYRHEKHKHLYYHVFGKAVPDEFYPDCDGELDLNSNDFSTGNLGNGIESVFSKTIQLDSICYNFPDTMDEKFEAWEFISKWTGTPELFHYHGMFMKADNFGRYYFKFFDEEVQRRFMVKKCSLKFMI